MGIIQITPCTAALLQFSMGRGLVRPLALPEFGSQTLPVWAGVRKSLGTKLLPEGNRRCLHVHAKCTQRTGKVRDTRKKLLER